MEEEEEEEERKVGMVRMGGTKVKEDQVMLAVEHVQERATPGTVAWPASTWPSRPRHEGSFHRNFIKFVKREALARGVNKGKALRPLAVRLCASSSLIKALPFSGSFKGLHVELCGAVLIKRLIGLILQCFSGCEF
ncbi:hypothetical protein GWK47_027915 [Chionoecetes opilio]|uniref:Uncharacterized protein n=1 Tax=Chionoecetes opilio TaxID=41210 RepID=A0A8J5D5X8_CHIOP|nr:hypothetical protein GWK47_027915 [Chionoecetes opilio]